MIIHIIHIHEERAREPIHPAFFSVLLTYHLTFTQLVFPIDFIEGKAFRWENIANFSDKYLIVDEEKTNKVVIKA